MWTRFCAMFSFFSPACLWIYIYCTLLVILIVIHQFGYGSRMGHQHPWLHVPGHIATTATKNLFIAPCMLAPGGPKYMAQLVYSAPLPLSAHSRKIHLCYIPIKKKESVFNQKAPIGDGSSPTDLFLFCVIGDGIKPSLQVT